ncbi:LysR family transcriptional regulator, partial [Nitrobacter sp. 62-23]
SHLRYVVAAAEHRSFRRAAAALNITQPTLSKRIRELESRLGVLLFERSTGGARLTVIGRDFVATARRVLSDLSFMENQAKAAKKGDAGQLDIGHYTSLSMGPLRDAIVIFTTLHPLVDVNLNAHSRTDLLSLLDRGSIDVAIMLGESKGQDYAHMSLWSDRIMVAFPKVHPLSDRDFVYWTDLKNERFLISIRDPGPELEDILLSKLAAPGDRPRIKTINGKREDVLSMVGAGRGISLICESATGNVVNGAVYREVRDGNGPTRVGLVAYWRHNNDNPTIKQFLAILPTHATIPSPAAIDHARLRVNPRSSC